MYNERNPNEKFRVAIPPATPLDRVIHNASTKLCRFWRACCARSFGKRFKASRIIQETIAGAKDDDYKSIELWAWKRLHLMLEIPYDSQYDKGDFVNYVDGANIGGFVRVADSMIDQGIV